MPDSLPSEATITYGHMTVAPCRCAEVRDAPNFAELAEEYAAEAAIRELPWPQVDWQTYQMLEDAGALHIFAARDTSGAVCPARGLLIGFIVLVTSPSAEYGVPLTCSEAFFVAKSWRHTGAGLALLAAAVARTRVVGSRGLAVNAPIDGRLAALLPKCGFREVGRMFFRSCCDG